MKSCTIIKLQKKRDDIFGELNWMGIFALHLRNQIHLDIAGWSSW